MSNDKTPIKPGKKKPRGKPFAGRDDPRRHTDGSKSSAAVSFNKEIRAIIVAVGEEEVTLETGQKIKRIEGAVRGMYSQAIKGNVQAFTALIERVEGKVAQPVTGKDGEPIQVQHEHKHEFKHTEFSSVFENVLDAIRADSTGESVDTAHADRASGRILNGSHQ